MDTTAPACVACQRVMHPTEVTRWVCSGCQQATLARLGELPALAALLPLALTGRRGTTLVGSRQPAGASEPLTLDTVDLEADLVARLVAAVRDWHETGAGELPEQWPDGTPTRVAVLCRWLRFRLDWACGQHAGAGDAVRDVRDLHGRLTARVGTAPDRERPVRLACPCGAAIPATVSSPGATCPGCGARYGRAELLALPVAARGRAAA